MCSSGTAVSSRCVQQSRPTVVSGSRVRQSCPANVSDDGRARQIPGPFHPTPLLYPKQCHLSSDRFVQFISNPSAEHDGHSANLLAWGEIILELAGRNGRHRVFEFAAVLRASVEECGLTARQPSNCLVSPQRPEHVGVPMEGRNRCEFHRCVVSVLI